MLIKLHIFKRWLQINPRTSWSTSAIWDNKLFNWACWPNSWKHPENTLILYLAQVSGDLLTFMGGYLWYGAAPVASSIAVIPKLQMSALKSYPLTWKILEDVSICLLLSYTTIPFFSLLHILLPFPSLPLEIGKSSTIALKRWKEHFLPPLHPAPYTFEKVFLKS